MIDQSGAESAGVSCMEVPRALDGRAVELLVAAARRFDSVACLVAGESRANAKSLREVARLNPDGQTPLMLEATGPDAQQAVDAVRKALARYFGE